MGDGPALNEVLARARRQVTGGRLRATVLRRLASVHGLDGTEVTSAVEQLSEEGIVVDGDIEVDVDVDVDVDVELDDERAPTDDDLAGTDEGPVAEHASLADCVARAELLLADRRVGRAHRKRVLTADEEIGLAALIRSGALPLNAPLPAGYRRTLPNATVAARAFDALVEHNVRLVGSIARSRGGDLMDLDDLVSSGMFGLLRAVEMFDATRGFKFSTYATWWIRQNIQRAVANEASTIRLPVHLVEQINRMRAAWARLEVQQFGEVRLTDVARALGVPPARVVYLLNVSRGTHSLDSPLKTDATLTLRDILPADGSLEEEYERTEATDVINDVLAGLATREARIIRLRYGIETGKAWTLEEVGQEFGLTRERIRQIQEMTLKKLRHPKQAARLRPYYNAN